MSPERWRRIEEVYHSVLERPPDQRAAFLAEVCGSDEELRREVESLLGHGESPAALFDRPAWEAAGELLDTRTMDQARDLAGSRISHYEIVEKLGEGGMGVVYKARDTRLGRLVAIKTLPREKVEDPDRKRRFVQEAKAASALNHPNIVSVYDIDQADGVEFISMEYVPGKMLGQAIGRKGLPVGRVLDYAVQMADALAAAHAAGIVHRDLKPANVIVTETGVVKLLDFGVAKLTQPHEPRATVGSVPVKTEEGAIVGTAAYMSPEQAEGKPVDARSDIFSFGAVLYEMVTGRRAFQGDTNMSTLAAIIDKEPKPVREIAEHVPELLERLILQCLRKPPGRRFQHMDDVKVQLEMLKEDSESGKLSAQAGLVPRRRRTPRILVASAVAAALLGAGAWYFLRPKPASVTQRPALTRLTYDSGLATDPVLSPDGTRVAYASDRDSEGNLDIWIQQVATGDRLRLTRNEADEHEPAFSPDGNRIAYRSEQEGGGIYVVSALGGEPRRIVRGGRGPRFSPDGEMIAYWAGGIGPGTRLEGGLFVIPSAGGEPRPVRADFKRAGYPEWLPDGRHILFYADSGLETDDPDIWVTSLVEDGTPAVRTGLVKVLRKQKFPDWRARWRWMTNGSGGGYLLGPAQSGDVTNIWRVPISPRTFQVSGSAEQLTFGTTTNESPEATAIPGGGLRMVFASSKGNWDIWSLPLDANHALVKGPPQRITDEESVEDSPAISEDGRKLLYASDRGGSYNVWARDLVSGKEARVNTTPGVDLPCISRDGRRTVYRKFPAGPPWLNVSVRARSRLNQVYMVAEGDPVLVCNDCFVPTNVTRDGEMLIDEDVSPSRLRVVMTARKEGVTILKGGCAGRLSPDERWIAFHTIPRIDARQVYVAPFRGPALIEQKEWIPVTDGRGMERYAAWSPDGNTLYFLSERDGFRCIRAQRLDPVSKRPVGPPLDIYHFHQARRSLMNITDPVYINLQVAVDKAVFAVEERTGSIWLTELPKESR